MAAKQSLFRKPLFQVERLRRVWRWAADEQGSVLIEAAIIFPVLIIILLGMVEFSQALTVKRRVQNVASTTADLIAQSQDPTAERNDIARVGLLLMRPFSSTGLSLTLTCIEENANRQITVLWSCSWSPVSSAGNCAPGGTAFTGLPAGLLNPGQSLIIGQTLYPYTPAIGQFLTGGVTFSVTSYFRPRLVSSCLME